MSTRALNHTGIRAADSRRLPPVPPAAASTEIQADYSIDPEMNRPEGRFILVGGGRLTIAVARRFLALGAHVTIIVPEGEDAKDLEAAVDAIDQRDRPEVLTQQPNIKDTLRRYSAQKVACVLALDDNREFNIKTVIAAQELDQPIVLRTFDPRLAETVENTIGNVRRAYSMAHLSAPFFVAGVLLRDASTTERAADNLLAMRAGKEYVVVCRLQVPPWVSRRAGTTLAGTTPAIVAKDTGCHVLARRTSPAAKWRVGTAPVAGFDRARDDGLVPGEEIVLAGPMWNVFDVLRRHTADPAMRRRHAFLRGITDGLRRSGVSAHVKRAWRYASHAWAKWLIAAFAVLTVVILILPQRDAADRVYNWVSAAVGSKPDAGVGHLSKGTEILASVGLLAGATLFGLGVALGATFLIERQLSERNERRVRRMTGHVVVVGLDEVAFHVTKILSQLNLACVVVDPNPGLPDTTAAQYMSLLGDIPVIRGELSQALNTARVDHAMGLIPLDNSNENNLVACLRANRSPARTSVRTVARIFDGEELGLHFEDWGVDRRLAAVDKAADAFVEGAVHELLVRSFKLPHPAECQWMHCVRCPAGAVSRDEWRRLYARGARAIAEVDGDGAMTPTAHSLDGIGDHNDAILVGPRTVMMELVAVIKGGSSPFTASHNGRRAASVWSRRGRHPRRMAGAAGAHPADNGGRSEVGG